MIRKTFSRIQAIKTKEPISKTPKAPAGMIRIATNCRKRNPVKGIPVTRSLKMATRKTGSPTAGNHNPANPTGGKPVTEIPTHKINHRMVRAAVINNRRTKVNLPIQKTALTTTRIHAIQRAINRKVARTRATRNRKVTPRTTNQTRPKPRIRPAASRQQVILSKDSPRLLTNRRNRLATTIRTAKRSSPTRRSINNHRVARIKTPNQPSRHNRNPTAEIPARHRNRKHPLIRMNKHHTTLAATHKGSVDPAVPPPVAVAMATLTR